MRRMDVPETCCPPLPPRVPRRPNSSARRALFPGALRNSYLHTAVDCPSRGNTPPWPLSITPPPPPVPATAPAARWPCCFVPCSIRPCFGCRRSNPAVATPHPAAARPIDCVTAAQRRRRRGVPRVAGRRCGPVRAPHCHWSARSRLRPRRHDRTAAEAVAKPDLSPTALYPPLLRDASPPPRRHDRDRQCKKVHAIPCNSRCPRSQCARRRRLAGPAATAVDEASPPTRPARCCCAMSPPRMSFFPLSFL